MKHTIQIFKEHLRLGVVSSVQVHNMPHMGGYVLEWESHGPSYVLETAIGHIKVFRNIDTIQKFLMENNVPSYRVNIDVPKQQQLQLVGG